MADPIETQMKLNSPALAPPPGVNPDFSDPGSLHVVIIIVLVLCPSISTLVYWMRMYTKVFIIRKTGWEDYTFLAAWLMYMGYCVPSILFVLTRGGVHQWNIRVRDMMVVLYYSNIASITYGIAIALVKLSLLLQYLKIFVPIRNHNSMVLVTYFIIGMNLIFYLIATFFEIFACSPRKKIWNRLITNGHCFDVNALNIASATINCVSDFIILLLPQGVIWRLQMPFRRKLGLSAIFLTGFLACIISIVRIYVAVRVFQTGDISYNFLVLGFWSHAEITFGIVCGCLPILPRFFSALRPKVSMLLKSYVELWSIPRWLRLSQPSRKRGDVGSSRRTCKGSYQLQRDRHSREEYGLPLTVRKAGTASSSAAYLQVRSIAPLEEDRTTSFDSVESGIEHVPSHPDCADLDHEGIV